MSKTRFVGFDGAAVVSGIHTGVAVRTRRTFSRTIMFTHCRAHAPQLAVISASHSFPDIARCLSSLKSLVNFIDRSSSRLSAFEGMQEVLGNQRIKLSLPGDTRWLSNAIAVRALLRSYRSALSTFETYLQRRWWRLCPSPRSPRYPFDSVDDVHSSCNGPNSWYTISLVRNHSK